MVNAKFDRIQTFIFRKATVTVRPSIVNDTQACVEIEEWFAGALRTRFAYTDILPGDTYRSIMLRATGRKRLWTK